MKAAGLSVLELVGHGVGLINHEPPFLDAHNEIVLQEGMTLSIEPWIIAGFKSQGGDGIFGIQDTFVVTDKGCEAIADLIATDEFDMGDYILIVPPQHQKSFLSEGWSKKDVEECIKNNCYRTIAELKRRSKWGWWQSKGTRAYTGERPSIEPADITERVYLFKKDILVTKNTNKKLW